MDGMLSQDEINALLSGMDPGDSAGAAPAEPAAAASASSDDVLSDVEKDAVGEVANISMGSSATTLYSLVNRKVNITTPVVSMVNWDGVTDDYEKPCVFIQIHYTAGLDGSNILVLREHDVKVITDLMMGGDGTNTDGELGELHLSAISEAMNQMMGASATSMSSMLGIPVDISTPDVNKIDVDSVKMFEKMFELPENHFVKVTFHMEVGDLIDSIMVQLYPLHFAEDMIKKFAINKSE